MQKSFLKQNILIKSFRCGVTVSINSIKVGDEVCSIRKHKGINVTPDMKGIVTTIEEQTVEVAFPGKNGIFLFQIDELRLSSIPLFGHLHDNAKAEGVKHDQEKPDMSLLSPIAMFKIAEVM